MGKLHDYGQNLACRGLTFVPLDSASRLLGLGENIAKASRLLIPLLASGALPYDEALNWLQFSYTWN